MAKKKKHNEDLTWPQQDPAEVQNEKPMSWDSFESFWHECVKNGTPSQMNACKEHLKSLGWLGDQAKWIDGALHFGIPMEK